MNSSPEEALFALALAKRVEKRAAFLDVMCDGDAALRARLDALLAAHEQPETLLATQADTASGSMPS
jgi:eukaryotic-like serine/threonine-protein kinase